jgi:ureidoacrylate peracid hydrolase
MEITLPAEPEPIKLDTERTALVVVDMQNAFCKKGGMFDVLGLLDEAKAKRVIKAGVGVVAASRRRGIKVVFLQMAHREDLPEDSGSQSPSYWKALGIVAMREHPEWRGRFLAVGSWDWEIIEELTPQPEDIIIDKRRYSGFIGTELDAVLKEHNIRHLVFIGMATNICVESTLRDAYFHEYFPVIISNGCGNIGPDYTQDATLWNVARLFGWVATAEGFAEALK